MMWNRAELKMRGNMAFKKNYVSAVVVALLMGIFGTVSGESSARRVSENSDIYSGNLFNVGMITGLLAGIATVVILIVLVAKVFVGNLLKMGGYRFFILNQTAQPLEPVHPSGKPDPTCPRKPVHVHPVSSGTVASVPDGHPGEQLPDSSVDPVTSPVPWLQESSDF